MRPEQLFYAEWPALVRLARFLRVRTVGKTKGELAREIYEVTRRLRKDSHARHRKV